MSRIFFVLIFFVCLSEQLLSLKTFCNFVKQFSQIVGKRQFSIVVECRESMQSNLSATQTWLIKLRGSNWTKQTKHYIKNTKQIKIKNTKTKSKTKTQKQTQNIEATQTWWNVLLSWGKRKNKTLRVRMTKENCFLMKTATRVFYKVNDTCNASQWQCWQRDFKILSGESRTKTLYSERNCFSLFADE